MKAGELTLKELWQPQQQYIIPIFQRYYHLGPKGMRATLVDICELHDNPDKRHFMGALVFVPNKTPVKYMLSII